jgi:PAS domain S-box-containing protein
MSDLYSILLNNLPSELFAALTAALVIIFRSYISKAFICLFNCLKKISANFITKFKYYDLVSCLNDIKTQLNNIQIELKPNGGSSLRDAINKIDKKVDKMNIKLENIHAGNELMSDTLNIARWSADKNGHITYVNRPLKKLIGAVDDTIYIGNAWISNIVHVHDRNVVEEEWYRAVDSKSEYHHSFRIQNLNDGYIIKVTNHAKLVKDEYSGEIIGWAGVLIAHDN